MTVQAQILDLLAGTAGRAVHGGHPRHPRPGRGRRTSRRHRGDVRRPDRRDAPATGRCSARCAIRTPRRCSTRSPSSTDPSHTRLDAIPGRPPDIVNPPTGCTFAPRCPTPSRECREEDPRLVEAETAGHFVRLLLPGRHPRGRAGARSIEAPARPRRPADRTRRRRLMAGTGHAPPARPPDEVLLQAENLIVEFPVGRKGRGPRRQRHQLRRDRGRDARPGRRVGLRQVDHRPRRSSRCRNRPRADRSTSRATTSPQLKGEELRRIRPELQMIFQDPISSLNPRRKIDDIVAEGLDGLGTSGTEVERSAEGRRDARRGRDRPRSRPRPPAAPVLRRPVPAHLDRPGPRARSQGASSATSRSRRSTCRCRPRS